MDINGPPLSDFGSTQSLHRAIQVYTESTQSKSSQHRIYTEQFGVYTESTQSNADLHRVYTEQYGVYTESTQSNTGLHRVYTD